MSKPATHPRNEVQIAVNSRAELLRLALLRILERRNKRLNLQPRLLKVD
jgi:hypothetical protein